MNRIKDESYVIGRDYNSKDWWVYDNSTDEYEQFFDTEEEAIAYVLNLEHNKWNDFPLYLN